MRSNNGQPKIYVQDVMGSELERRRLQAAQLNMLRMQIATEVFSRLVVQAYGDGQDLQKMASFAKDAANMMLVEFGLVPQGGETETG